MHEMQAEAPPPLAATPPSLVRPPVGGHLGGLAHRLPVSIGSRVWTLPHDASLECHNLRVTDQSPTIGT